VSTVKDQSCPEALSARRLAELRARGPGDTMLPQWEFDALLKSADENETLREEVAALQAEVARLREAGSAPGGGKVLSEAERRLVDQ
jgi:hypothetical protein